MSTNIYGLYATSRPSQIRYIGQTKKSINKRLVQHRYQAKNLTGKTPVGKWIRKHSGNIGVKLLIENAIWDETEIKVIAKYRKKQSNLLNVSAGGNGNQREYISEQHKKLISKKLKGVKKSDSHKQNISNGKKGIKLSYKHKKNMSEAQLGNISAKGSIRTKELREQVAIKKGSKLFIVTCKKTGKKIGQWINKRQCALELNINASSVYNVLNGWSDSTKHYNFKYVEGNI